MDWVHHALKTKGKKLAQQQLAALCSGLRELASQQDLMMPSLGSQITLLLQKLDQAAPTAATLEYWA